MTTLAERLTKALKFRGLSKRKFQLALQKRGARGASYASVHSYFQDSPPPLDFVAAAAEELGVRRPWLAFGDGPMTDQEAPPREIGTHDLERARRLQDRNAVTDMIREYTGDRARDARAHHGRLTALLRFAQKLDDALSGRTPPTVGRGSDLVDAYLGAEARRREILKAAALFLVGVERAFQDAGKPRPHPIEGMPSVAGAPPGLLLGDDSFSGWYAVWADGVIDLFARRVAALAAPVAKRGRTRVSTHAEKRTRKKQGEA